mmetsp:Transcript_69957/g.130786  ORF Transcript_69957/g.130786 Transcript_69957/m.130786 type:complete len:266 (+) Transcript_69957:19-816(+)
MALPQPHGSDSLLNSTSMQIRVGILLAVLLHSRLAASLRLRQQSKPVVVDFYFGPLCGYCHHWALHELKPLWHDSAFKPLLGTAVVIRPHALYLTHNGHMKAQAQLMIALNCIADHLDGADTIETLLCMEEHLSYDHSPSHIIKKCILSSASKKLEKCVEQHGMTAANSYQKKIFRDAPSGFVHNDGSFYVPYFAVNGHGEGTAHDDFREFVCQSVSKSQRPSQCHGGGGGGGSSGSACDSSHPCLLAERDAGMELAWNNNSSLA